MPHIQIQMAELNDAVAIASVLDESFREYKSLYTREGYAATTPNSEQIKNRIRLNEGPTWLALYDDRIVGTVSAVKKKMALYIRSMAVRPAARGKKIGELLLIEVEIFASENGYKRLFLSTTSFLTRAIRLYEHFGFYRINEGPDNLFGTPLFTMEKVLEP
ncbi:GNAT family N-acetyltransferase [candidate division KSB1 bacterium]|nr:GNAT family N-acetyltransferase [candidate division KSB1 bacterium]NIR69260.1 GNAT family N-acetyltransferase [candidate division KSB1 bacterium]NIS27433.1 GNAT family N-acetyltransferase [candidate division KSB1 bacterium]NIT74259.1 GNAT family N-acetyltransferase [candidate division KSB1 bacterium]NIU28151.1 GNAT family N-acetyltransferase [candidate division KSB1 bacterium]